MWNDVSDSWGHAATPEMIAKARAVPASMGQIQAWPALWASEIVRVAPQVFHGPQFQPKQGDSWEVKITDPNYRATTDHRSFVLVCTRFLDDLRFRTTGLNFFTRAELSSKRRSLA